MNFEQHDQHDNTEAIGLKTPDYFKDFTYNTEQEDEDVVLNKFSDTHNNIIDQAIIKETTPQIADLKQDIFTPEHEAIIAQKFDNGFPYYGQTDFKVRDNLPQYPISSIT